MLLLVNAMTTDPTVTFALHTARSMQMNRGATDDMVRAAIETLEQYGEDETDNMRAETLRAVLRRRGAA